MPQSGRTFLPPRAGKPQLLSVADQTGHLAEISSSPNCGCLFRVKKRRRLANWITQHLEFMPFPNLRHHPFPIVARFERVVALSFAFPESVLRPLVPDALEIDTHSGFGFLTVAMVWTKKLRPTGFPAFLGQDLFQFGYRVFTRLRQESGRKLRGLKIVRSETDKRRMVWLGNLMTGYRYRRVNLRIAESASETSVETNHGRRPPNLGCDVRLTARGRFFARRVSVWRLAHRQALCRADAFHV